MKAWYGQAGEDQLAAAAVEGALVAPFAYRMIDGLARKVAELQGVIDARNRISAPATVPYFRAPAVPAPAPAPAPKPADPRAWSDVDTKTDPLKAAASLVDGSLKKMFG